MILKLFTAWIPPEHRAPFSRGQIHWRGLKGAEGFLGQSGGWAGEEQVAIASLWASSKDFAAFEADLHDPLFEASGQAGLYEEGEGTRWERVLDIPGASPTVQAALGAGGFMRIALATVLKARQPHFIEVQRGIWNPGMAARGDMLGGFFGKRRNPESPGSDDFIILTFWRTPEAHQSYMNEAFAGLRDRAQPTQDCVSISGMRVPIEGSWIVRG